MRQLIGKSAAHLHCRTLTSNRCTEEVGNHGSDQHHRHHAQRNNFFRIVDLINDQVVSGINRFTHQMVGEPHDEASNRK
ncbi:hypothetical protein [Pseudomonas sp. 28 E 9]|nr:hypothetical protein [Pseudomonas sp. 28 E 9]